MLRPPASPLGRLCLMSFLVRGSDRFPLRLLSALSYFLEEVPTVETKNEKNRMSESNKGPRRGRVVSSGRPLAGPGGGSRVTTSSSAHRKPLHRHRGNARPAGRGAGPLGAESAVLKESPSHTP